MGSLYTEYGDGVLCSGSVLHSLLAACMIAHLPLSTITVDRWPIDARVLALVRHLERGGSVPPFMCKCVNTGATSSSTGVTV